MALEFKSINDKSFALYKEDEIIVFGEKNKYSIGVHHKRSDILVLTSNLTKKKFTIKINELVGLGVSDKLAIIEKINTIITNVSINVGNGGNSNGGAIQISGLFLHPHISCINGSFFSTNSNADISLHGANFDVETTVEIPNQTVNSVTYVSPHLLIVNVSVDSTIGTFDVIVKNNTLEHNKLASLEVGIRELYTINWKSGNSNVTIDGTSLTKNAVYGWNGGAISDKGIYSNDGYIEFEPLYPTSGNRRYMLGLSYTDKGYSYTDINYALYFNTKNIYIYENGKNVMSIGNSWQSGDVFKICIENNSIVYRKNNIFLYKSRDMDFEYPLFVDTSLYERNIAIDNVKIFGKLIEL